MSEYTFKLPDLAEGTVEAEIGEWNVDVGTEVKEGAIIGTMVTEKAAVEIPSPVSGRVVSLAGNVGDVIAVGTTLIVFDVHGAVQQPAAEIKAPEEPPAEPEQPTQATPPPPDQPDEARVRVTTSPAIRRMAKEANVNLAQVRGSGPAGRILRRDLEKHLQRSNSDAARQSQDSLSDTTIEVVGIRRMIAERMTAAKREIPHFSYVEEIDVTELEALRNHLNTKKGEEEQRFTLLPFIGMALIRALRQFPQCNATYDSDRIELTRHTAVHLGIATQTDDGLKVPVVRHCERRSLEELADGMRRVSSAARDRSIGASDLTGSTITVTSLGKLGGIATTPIINLPEVAVIGVNKAVQRPVVMDGQVAIRLMMNLSSSFDHRFVDGYDAAAMIRQMKNLLEHPATLFMNSD